jgi:SAM-dependent methyltransferase
LTGERRFRTDLYAGTAEWYDRFRPPYPVALLDDLRARVPLGPASRVLDLACGTGQIAFPLCGDVASVWAVDQEAGSVAFGRAKAARLGVSNIVWAVGAAETVPLPDGLDLVAIGNAFQRLDRMVVAGRLAASGLAPGGCVALLWGRSPWDGSLPWQRSLRAVIERWVDELGARDRVPAGWEEEVARVPHHEVLRGAGLAYEGRFEFPVVERWDAESLIGFLFSTSFLSPTVVRDRAPELEADLGRALRPCDPAGTFEQPTTFAYDLARRVI